MKRYRFSLLFIVIIVTSCIFELQAQDTYKVDIDGIMLNSSMTKEDIINDLKSIGITNEDNILIHSSLKSFGNVKGEMIMAAVVEYNDNADGDGQGNWNYYWTFDPKDIEGKRRYQYSSTQVHTVIAKRGYELYRLRFSTPTFITESAVIFANLMRELLETNAKDGEEFTVEHEGYFLATSAVEDGVVEKSFLPDGAMKRLIKDDAATELAV